MLVKLGENVLYSGSPGSGRTGETGRKYSVMEDLDPEFLGSRGAYAHIDRAERDPLMNDSGS